MWCDAIRHGVIVSARHFLRISASQVSRCDTSMNVNRATALLLLVLLCAPPWSAYAHGVVGDYVFLEPLVAEDPTPANEFDIVEPGWARTSDGRTFSLGNEIERVLRLDSNGLPRFSGGGAHWAYQWPRHDHGDNGFDDLEVFGK